MAQVEGQRTQAGVPNDLPIGARAPSPAAGPAGLARCCGRGRPRAGHVFGLRTSFFPGLCLTLLLLCALGLPAQQLVISNQGGGTIIIQGQGAIRLGPGGQVLDPQVAAAMQMSGAGQPAEAQAEFDPPSLAVGQTGTYRVVVTASTEAAGVPVPLPAPPGLELEPTGRAFSYGQGIMGIQPRTTFNFRVRPTRAGEFLMPAYNATANTQPVPVAPSSLRVLPAGSPVPPSRLRLVAQAPTNDFYIGEMVPIRLRLTDPGDGSVAGFSQAQVSGDAFIVDQNLIRYRRDARVENGRIVGDMVADLAVQPVKEGRLPLRAQAMASLLRQPQPGGITLPGYQPLVDAEPVMVNVKRLPVEGRPASFTGAIGMFDFEQVSATPGAVRAGEPLTLAVTLRGVGNIHRIVPPKLAWAKGWQVFAPVVGASVPSMDGQPGMTTFTYTMIPLNNSVKATPEIPFSVFNPAAGTYAEMPIPPVPIQVFGGADVPVVQMTPQAREDDPDEPDLKLAGLMTTPGSVRSTMQPVQAHGWFIAGQLLPALTLGGLWWWDRRRRYLADHPEVVARARARRALRRELRRLGRAARAQDAQAFVEAAARGFQHAAAPFTQANPAALVAADVLGALPATEREGEAGRLVRQVFGAGDRLHFLDQPAESASLLALRTKVEGLLRAWRERL
jgi:hypothetical protein